MGVKSRKTKCRCEKNVVSCEKNDINIAKNPMLSYFLSRFCISEPHFTALVPLPPLPHIGKLKKKIYKAIALVVSFNK